MKLHSLAWVEPLKYDLWVWPKRLDIGVYDGGDLLCVLKKVPKLAKRRGIFFKVDTETRDEIQDLFLEKLQKLFFFY